MYPVLIPCSIQLCNFITSLHFPLLQLTSYLHLISPLTDFTSPPQLISLQLLQPTSTHFNLFHIHFSLYLIFHLICHLQLTSPHLPTHLTSFATSNSPHLPPPTHLTLFATSPHLICHLTSNSPHLICHLLLTSPYLPPHLTSFATSPLTHLTSFATSNSPHLISHLTSPHLT